MSKKQKIHVGTVVIDPAQAIRKASRAQFGHMATSSIPDKKRKQTHSRQPKHRRPYEE